ncbi:hypothetical protein HY642_00990 [Candidatus Woesearchaeota archaeon]|nr:hypothetical protein [Candidatus Woesearchaeota archaeon]
MSNTNQDVWKILQSDLAAQKDLNRKIINIRALAKYILHKYGLRASLDAVISAIRRFQSEELFEEEQKALLHVFHDAIVSTKNNMASITAKVEEHDFIKRLSAGDKVPDFKVVTGTHAFKLIVDQPRLDRLLALLKKDEIVSVENDLSEISITASEKAAHTKGVLARIASELALANINIIDMLVAMPEFLIYVKQRDIVKAHESILKLSMNNQ